MIRAFKNDDTNEIMRLWLDSNIDAHSFIPREYWEDNFDTVREMLPGAEIYVYEQNGEIMGFAGMQEDYLAGIFVRKKSRSRGVGKMLLDLIKQRHPNFRLSVYKENLRAVSFYRREGLRTVSENIDSATGQIEYVMEWTVQT